MTSIDARPFLLELWRAAIDAVTVGDGFTRFLPGRASGRTIVIGAGKAAAAMAAAAVEYYGPNIDGVVVTRHGHGLRAGETNGGIRIIEAGHPLPDSAGVEAGRAVLDAVSGLHADDLVICLLSGGGSALLEYPVSGASLADIGALNRALLQSGAAISEINCVRKHLSAIKGGRLAVAAWPARVVTLAISDVPGDDPSVIASGPTVADPTTAADAIAILQRHRIDVPPGVTRVLARSELETPKSDDPRVRNTEYRIVATQSDALNAASAIAAKAGYSVVNRGTRIEGEARTVATHEAHMAFELASKPEGSVILGGGELTVTLDRRGTGGPNREYALALALALTGHPRIWALAADTDGIDGTDDGAGAIVTPDTLLRARRLNLHASKALADHDSGTFFSRLGDALVTGPTRTNVSDFRAIVILPDMAIVQAA
ncbi:MAG: glycerate kinase [Rhizomicrobium sp.]|jgi:hydroxypyruvate reductase